MKLARFTLKRPEGVAENFEALPPVANNEWHGLASWRHGLNPEKFIVAAHLNEQLTKASRHLSEILVLARALNRTLVLPDVGHSEMGMPQDLPFSTYFDTEKLGEYVDWVTWEQFVFDTRVKHNPDLNMSSAARFVSDVRKEEFFGPWDIPAQRPITTPSGEYDWLEEGVAQRDEGFGGSAKPSGAILVLKTPGHFCGTRVQTFMWQRLQYFADSNVVLCVDRPPHGSDGPAPDALEKVVREVRTHTHPVGVLFVIKNREFNLFLPRGLVAQANEYLVPAPQIMRAVSRMRERLGERHVAVQWRFEKCLYRESECDAKLLRRCARGLVIAITEYLAAINGTHVFFASDAPTRSGKLRSTSYWNLQDPEAKMRLALDTAQYVINNTNATTWEDYDPSILEMDSGVQALLDREVCVAATVFMTAPPECSDDFSEFVLSIRQLRKARGLNYSGTWEIAGEDS